MKIVISGDRAEGKTTLIIALGRFLSDQGWAVVIEHSLDLQSLQDKTQEGILGLHSPRTALICEENSSEEVWNGMIEVDGLGKVKRKEP